MDSIKLKDHVKKGDTFFTCFTNPDEMGKALNLSSWSREKLPDYIWLALIVEKLGRKKAFEQLYLTAKDLAECGMAMSNLSNIVLLDEKKQNEYWKIVSKYIDLKILSPLTVVFTSEKCKVFFEKCFNSSMDIDSAVDDIISLLKKCISFHDELSTDVCFISDWFEILSGKIHFSSELKETTTAFCEYYKHEHSDDVMRMYRPIVRSFHQGISQINGEPLLAEIFWKSLGELSECRLMLIEWEDEVVDAFYKETKELIEYISVTNEGNKFDTKYAVIISITCYIYKIYKEIVEKELFDSISGRIAFRTMVEAYIMLKYIVLHEQEVPDIYDQFKAYGIGKYKLVMAKLREGKYSIDNDSQIENHYLELLVNEDYNEMFVNMSIGYFDKTKIKDKFSECGEDKLYEIYYEYGTNYAHGFWGAIRESAMLFCDNPAHGYHAVPDYLGEQKLKSVRCDCEMIIKKVLATISSEIDMPEFYYNSKILLVGDDIDD